MRTLYFSALLIVLWGLSSPTKAIEITKLKQNSGPDTVLVTGKFDYNDEKKFLREIIDSNDAIIIFGSEGGSLIAGIEIGKIIRMKGFKTYVADNQICASACAFAWLGGIKRFMSDTAFIGFHAAYTKKDGEAVTSGSANALLGAYLSQLGLSNNAIFAVTAANPNEIYKLTFSDAQKYGIEVSPFNISINPSSKKTVEQNQGKADSWNRYGNWIQTSSKSDLAEAIEVARRIKSRIENVFVFSSENGLYAVVVGPYPAGSATPYRNDLISKGIIPKDSYVTEGKRYVTMHFGSL